MKKRIFCAVLVLYISIVALFANQKTYDYSDVEYKYVKYLIQVSDKTGPHDTTPLPGVVLINNLEKIDKNRLPSHLESLYEKLYKDLHILPSLYNKDSMMFDLDTFINPEMYIKAGDNSVRQDWYYGYEDRLSLISLDLDFAWSNYVYGKLVFPYKIKIYDQYNEIFSQNIFKPNSGESYQRRMPFDVGLSLGSDFMNFYIGRGQLNMGSGFTGNLLVSDNFQYQDFAKLSFYGDLFSYDFSYTYFDQENKVDKNGVNSLESEMSFSSPYQIRITHSYTFDFADKVTFSVREGAMLETESALDIRMFNPFMILHNWNGFSAGAGYWANNILELELTAALGMGFRINWQFVLDQFQLPNEKASGANDFPNAMGTLLNLSQVSALNAGFLENYIEFVYTSPYLYLNNIGEGNENQDFIVGYFLGDESFLSYSGYKYGPDSFVISLGGSYLSYDAILDISYVLMYRIHGERGIKHNANQNQTPVSEGGANFAKDFMLSGTLEHTILLGGSIRYKIIDSLSILSSISYQYKVNYNNRAGNWQNLQISFGVSFNPMEFLK